MTNRLRVAVLSRNFSATGGGAERYSIAMVEELAARHEVHVFAQNIAHQFPRVTYHPVPTPTRRPRWVNQLYFAFATWRATRKGFDIVHSHENTWHGNVQTVHVLPIKHTLFTGREGIALALRWLKVLTSPRLLTYLWLERQRYALLGRRRIVLTSHALKEVMLTAYPHAQSAMEVIAPGVASVPGRCSPEARRTARSALGLPMEGHGLLFVGNDFRKKGLPTLLEAMAELPADCWLAVVGQSRQIDSIRQRVQALGVAQRVHFLGALSHMDDAYCAADGLVHPTLEDTYAMVVLEAMAHGLPVVVSGPAYCGIAADLTPDSDAVVIEDPTSAANLASAIRRIQDDSQLADRLSEGATKFADGHTWKAAAQYYEALYDKVAPVFRRRWLVLSHAFNMDGRAASQTITDKLPHLERAGIELVVLSGVSGRKDEHYEHHQLWPAGPAGLRFELRHVLRRHLGSRFAYRLVMLACSLPLFPFMLVEKLLRPVESSWSWWLSAYCKGLWLARTRKFDLIYSTGGAFAAHVAGLHLKNALKTSWVAEVHDPLVTPGREGTGDRTAQEKMQARVERLICTHADIAIWFTERALLSALRRNPQLGERGKMMIPGVDRPATVLQPYQPSRNFVIGHFGSLSTTRNLVDIVRAVEILVAKRPEAKKSIQLHLYGGPLDPVSVQAIASSSVKECVHHFGRIENDPVSGKTGREQILQRMRNADVLLLLHGEEPICEEYIPSKLYEYLWMQRPILAIVHRNPQMVALIRGQGHEAILSGNRKDGRAADSELTVALEQLFDRWRNGSLADNGQASLYTTQAATGQLLTWVHDLPKGCC
ncbi:MAG: glycosyltransferase [Burkholderiales bacterium]|nr:glycosyltransferase [Burkholderiales bacterium]